jgi:hypothetical protein
MIMVATDTYRELEDFYEVTYDPESEEAFDLAEALEQRDLPEWQKQVLLETHQIEANSSRYLAIPQADSYEGYNDMEAFIFTVEDSHLQDQLWQAIRGRGAFRRFKDTLAGNPRERNRWFEFKDKLMEQRVLDWLASTGTGPPAARSTSAHRRGFDLCPRRQPTTRCDSHCLDRFVDHRRA